MIPYPIVTHHGAHGVGAMPTVITGGGRILATEPAATVDGIMPVVIVIRRGAVPAAILTDERGVIPLIAGILATHHDALPPDALLPQLRSRDLDEVPLDGGRGLGPGQPG